MQYRTTRASKRLSMMAVMMALVAVLALAGCGGTPAPDAAPAADTGAADAAPAAPEVTVLNLARFFGDCDDTTAGVTDVSLATTECEVIAILTNKFNADHPDIQVQRLGGSEWGTYYDALNTTFAGKTPPDVAVMHGSNLPDYASRGLLLDIGDRLAAAGIDTSNWTVPAQGAVTYDGVINAIPFDLHANLAHINVDIFTEAGLVDDAGMPILPTSREEFFQQAATVTEKTGKQYFATDASQFPIGVRLMFALVWQQNGDLLSADRTQATVNTPEAAEALDFMLTMFNEGYADPNQNYDASQGAFLTGDVAMLMNGTWAVDQYNREAPFSYMAMDFPTLYDTPATWANSHTWAIPVQESDAKYDAAITFLAFLNDHVEDWAKGTGHLASRTSVLESESYAQAPQRANYANTANIARLVPAILNWQAVEDILKEELESTWLAGVDPAQALQNANDRINDTLTD